VWESPSWWDVFSHLASGGSSAPSGEEGQDIPNGEAYTEIEDATECGKAVAVAAFAMVGCGGLAGVALAATGASAGIFAGSFVAVVSACGIAAVAGIDAMDKCEEEPALRDLGLDDLLEYTQVIEHEEIRDYIDVEDFYEQYAEIEELDYDFSMHGDAEEVTNRCVAIISNVDESLAP